MEEDFKKVIEDIKEDDLDPEQTKKYILKIKRVFRQAFENCKDEYDESEIFQMCMEEYYKDLEFRGNAQEISNNMLKYDAYRKMLSYYVHDKSKFEQLVKSAMNYECRKDTILDSKIDGKIFLTIGMRQVLLNSNSINEREIVEYIRSDRNRISNKLRRNMIKMIQSYVAILEEYGIIDEYINLTNDELETMGLGILKYSKRNPIADEEYEDGELVENKEDIGVIDTFSTENLMNMSIENLEMMLISYQSKYFQERLELSKAMTAIRTLDLRYTIFHEGDEAIEYLDDDLIEKILKKDLALTYLGRKKIEITPEIRERYNRFLDKNGIISESSIEEELKAITPEVSNLCSTANDLGILQALLIYQLKEKSIKVKKWGIVKSNEEDEEIEDEITIAIENENFRGPLLIVFPEDEAKKIKISKYKGNIDKNYRKIMSRLYLPKSKFYELTVKKMYDENPQSNLIASLAGKKIKEGR